jgi:hypothetical protein
MCMQAGGVRHPSNDVHHHFRLPVDSCPSLSRHAPTARLQGTSKQPGLIPRTLDMVMQRVAAVLPTSAAGNQTAVSMSYFEVRGKMLCTR